MVRETRYLWIGNLPHTIREDRILEHFKRYGKVQSVKILPKKEEENGACATVAFIDIKSASKAHNADNKIDERTLKTDYYEPPASSTASSAIYIHERDDALVRPAPAPYTAGRTPRYGLSEERNYERPGHYYADREPYMRRPLGIGYHDEDNYQGRAKSRDRYSRSAPGNNYTEGAERNQNHFRPHNARQHFDQQRYPVGDQYNDEREPTANSSRLNRRTNNTPVTPAVASVASPTTIRTENRPRRTKRRSPSRTPSGSRSNSGSRSRSRSSSGSRSSSSSSKLRSSSSDSSGRSRSPSKSRSPVSALYGSQNNTKGSRLDRPSSAIANPSSTVCYLPSAVNASAINCTSNNTQGSTPSQGCTLAIVENHCDREEKRPLGICVRNLPVRSTDTSLKDGLFHEYKKHGKVTMVKVIGQGTDRYAVVCFKKPEDVDKALEVSKDKLFFGCKIEVTAHEGLDAEDNEFRPLEAELDEFHPKATRTLFIGNLEKDITTPELRKHFDQFGEIIEIDIKKQGSATSYAFIQYSDIASVVKAMRKLDGENLGANRIKLGFGKSMPTNCVWLDGIVDSVSDKFLSRHFSRFGIVAYTAVDREKGHALVFYENVDFAQIAVSEMRGRILQGKKLQVDFASRECQTTFFDKLEMTGQMVPGDGTRPWERRERRGPEFEVVRNDDREPRVGFENRVYPRYEAQPRPPRGNFRGGQRAGFSSRGRGQGFSARYEVYHDEFGERRHRYNSRDESVPEVTLFDGKVERPKYVETPECPNRKRNKLRNSISDQESHHSQSPPRSCHQSRSTSPVSKDRKSLKERLHHRVKSPGSHNSSLVNSPCRDVVSDEMETNSDYRDSRSKSDEIITDLSYTSPINTSPRSTEKDVSEKALLKGETDSLRSRSSVDADSADESCSTSDQLGRKKRFLACSLLKSGKEQNTVTSKSVSERAKGKVPNSHVNSLKPVKLNCVSDETVEENKCDTDNSVQQEYAKVKPHQTESANTDLKYLQKKQVQLLHMLEELGENANSSDTEGLIDGERVTLKKHRSPSACSETNSLCENDSLKSLTKDECGIKLCKKDPAIFTTLKSKADAVDSNNCISLSLDSFIFQKHLDPRKGCDQHSVSISSVNSLQKCRRISVDNETCLPILQGANDSFLCAPLPITDVSWRKECNSLSDIHFPETDGSLSISHLKVKEETISDDDTLINKKSSFPLDLPNRILSLRTLSDMRHEVKRERDISPLSLPLPKFAASLRSPKSSPSVLTSPKSTTAHSPRAGLSPSSYASGKNIRIADLLQDFQIEKKTKDSDEKVNGASVSPVDSISPFETQAVHETAELISMESIQSPKSNCEKVKESNSSSESEISPSSSPNRPSIEDRIKALDEKFNAWSGSTRTTVATPDAAPVSVPEVPKCPVKRSRFNFLAPEIRSEPSEIVKSILARSTIFDQDSKRLQHIDEKYEPVNVKMESPPKVKPTFRTKAAAKEFSMPIAPATQTFNQSSLVKNPSTILVAQSIMSPPSTPQSATGSVLSPVTPPIQQFNSQLTPQVFAPCSPCATTPVALAPCTTIKNSEGLNSVIDKDFSDHVLKSATVFNSVKVKAETNFHVNSSALATSLKSPLHCPVEVTPHTMVVSSPPSIKKEPSSPTDSVTETVCKFEIDCKVPMKKEVPVNNITNIPLRKDGCISLTKDHLHFNSFDNDKKEFCDSKDPRLSFHEGSSHWRENGCKDDIKVNVDSCAKSFTGNPDVPVNSLGPATKKRVSSIDSTESESSKSVKSLDSSRDSHEINWSKHEKTSEPEPKKPKLCKSVTQDRSSSPPPSQPHPKKTEKKEKNVKPEKSKTSTLKSSSSNNAEKTKSIKSEYKDKSKSEHKNKDEKRSKSRDSKESTSSKDQRTKSRERRNSEKDNKAGCSNNPSSKSKKEPHVVKNESKHEIKGDSKFENKGDSKFENKADDKGDSKHENKGEGRHENKGEGRHENKGEGRHESKGEGRHENKGEGRHENRGEGRHENKGEGRHENRGESRHDNRGEGRHENKGEGRHENKGEGRHENKGEGRHENKGEGRHENKGEGRHENKGEGRHENKGEGRHENKGEGRHENKGEGKHDNKSENRHENKGDGKHETKGEGKHESRSESKKERHESRHENKHEMKYESRHKSKCESKHEGKYENKSEDKNDSDNESKSEDAKGEKKQSEKKSSSKKSSSSSVPFDFQAFMDDEPVYFSMYDKVKARSSKSQTLKHQTSDLESVRQKFSKLKQSRAKREEKTKSIDQDSDKDSDSASHHSSESDSQTKSTKVKQPRKRKLVIESSSDDGAVSHDSSSRISKMEKDFNDSATDSDFEYNVSRRQSSSLKVRKKKTDVLNSDSSDSDSNFATKSQTSCSKKKSMQSRSKACPEKSKKIIRSDYEMSDLEVQQKFKEKDFSREGKQAKKLKKEKTVEIKQESESMDCESMKKTLTDDSRTYKKKVFKESKPESEVPSQKKVKSEHVSKEKQISVKEKKIESGPEKMLLDDAEKHKPYSKKRKKSKKMSKNKEKRSSTEKCSQDSSKKQDDNDARSSLPVLSPKPSNPLPEKQLSPPYLQAGVFSDNDFKSDFSDFDFETHQTDDADLNSDIWKQLDTKSDSNSDKSSKSKKKDSGLKSQSTVIQSPEQDSSLPSYFDKLSDITDSETGREPTDCTNDVLSDGQKHHDFPPKKEKESNVTLSPHKSKHEKHEDQSIKQESTKYSEAHLISSKEERRKKKSKKQSKEKKKKTREEKETPPAKENASSSILASSPKALFEPVVADDDSRLSDMQLDEVIADESRHFEQEFVVVTPETSTFDDDGPTKREEKLVERRFEEEAAKETRRLEAELFSTGRDSWHMKEKDYDPEASTGELCEEKQPCEIDSLTGKEENIFTGLDLHSSIIEPSQSEGDVFLTGQPESDPFQLDDKDVNEIEDQRKIEDDLAVSALLQEMQSSEISAPELTKETDYLDPLIETHPEDTMNYLLPDDGENSLHIADSSPEVQGNESQDEKLEPSVMLLSPSSNSEPPALEISNVEDSVLLKVESGGQTCISEPLKEKLSTDTEISAERKSTSCYDFHEDSMELCESKPPVIDIPVISDSLETNRTAVSPKVDRVKVPKMKEREKPVSSAVKADSNEDTDNESGSELAENQLTHFEDITMDTTDSKDDDNPPILMPVESPRNLLPVADPKEKIEPVVAVPTVENQSTNDDTPTKTTEQDEIAESVFDRLSSDIDKQFGEILNRISEQPKPESKPLRIPDPHERCSMNLNISDLSDPNSSDSLFINNAGIFSNSGETSSVIKSFIKSQETSNLNISNDLDEESNHCKYSLSESLNSAIDPPMLHYTDMLNPSCETPVIHSPPKADNDNDTMSLPDKSIQNLESFTSEVGDASAVSDTNQASSDSFLLDLFGPKSVENEKVETNSPSEKLKTDDDFVSNSDSKNKTEDSNVSSLDNNQSNQAASFAISEVNEQNEATEFNQEIFERSPDLSKDSKLPQLLSFSSEQLFTELTNKSTANANDSTSVKDNNSELNYQDILQKADDSLKLENNKTVDDHSKSLDSAEKISTPEPKIDEKSMDLPTEEHLSLEDSLDIKARPADAESVCSDTTDITIPETKGEAELNQVACSEEPMPEELHPVEDVDLSAKPKLERPRRGRRPKTRKYVETLTQKQDIILEPVVTSVTSTRSSSRRIRPTSSERPRRSLRSDNVETIVLREYGKKRHSVDESIHSETEDLKKDISGEISDGLVSDTAAAEADSIPSASVESLEQKSAEKLQTRNEEPRRRRGRRKKASNDNQPLSTDRLETKSEESDFTKEFHRPKESISWLSLLSSEKEQKSSKDNNPSSAYDIFEFRDEEEENPRFESVKERLHDTTRSTSSVTESKHTKVFDQKHEKVSDLKHERLIETKHDRAIDQKHDRLSDQKHDRPSDLKMKERLHDTTRSTTLASDSKHPKLLEQKLDKAIDLKHDRLSDQKHDRLLDQKVKERLHETTRSNASATDSKHSKVSDQKHDKTIDLKHDKLPEPKHERVLDQKHDKVAENIHEKEKKPDEAKATSEDRDIQAKEPQAEAKEHKKISIIIRFHSKDGHDGSSPGTARIVQQSEALNSEEVKQEPAKIEKISVKSDAPGSEAPYNGPCKSTRKSTRLMNQAMKSTVDEVIEDVVRNFKESSDPPPAESTPTRVTRRSRSNRRSEENSSRDMSFETYDDTTDDKNKNEPVFFIHDNAVKDIPEEKKKLSSQPSSEVAPAADVSIPDSDKIPLRIASLRAYRMSHRITRSTASKLESNRDTPVSTSPSDDQDLKKKDTISSTSSDEKSDMLQQKAQKEPKEAPKETKTASESSVVYHPPLPVLKVEINRVSSLELNRVDAKRVRVVDESSKEPPQSEKLPENDDSNSTSSTAELIDPVTGILTSVDKSEYYSEANNPSIENKSNSSVSDLSGISASVLNIKSVSKSNLVPDTVAATSVIQEGSKSTYSNKSENIPPRVPLVQSLRSRQNSSSVPAAVTVASDPPPTTNVETVSKIPSTTEKNVEPIKLPSKKTAVAASVLAIANSLASNSSVNTADHTESSIPSPVVTAQTSRGQSPVITGRAVPTINSPSPVTVLTHDKKTENVQSKVPTLPAHSYESPVRTTAVVTSVPMGHITSISSNVQNKCSTSSAVTCITSSKSELPVANTSANIQPQPVSEHVSSVASCKPLSLTASAPTEHSMSIKQEVHVATSSSLPSASIHNIPITSTWTASKITSDRIIDSHAHVSTIQSSTTNSSAYAKSDGRSSKPAHSGKNNSAFTQQTGFSMSNYEEMLSGAHGLAAASGSGVIAELLQNPQLLQQHKEFFTAGQLQDRNLVQMVRPGTPVAPNIPPEIAARLGNPTPPHTPTPPVTSSNHSLPPADIHSHSGLHIRHPSQPGLIVPPHASLGLHPSDMNAYVHQQMIYAAAHNPYAAAALHGAAAAQQEAQVRAAAMGMNSRFGYHSMPSSSIVSNNFKQPSEPRHPPSVMDAKSEQKLINELTKIMSDTRGSEEKAQRSKSMRNKKEFAAAQKEKELKMMHSDSRDDPESGRLIPSHEKIPSTSAIAPHSLRQPQHAHYSSQILQMSPRLTVSPHERITDSPVVANLYATGPGRVPQITLAGQVDDHKSESSIGAHASHHYKNDMSETIKPPVAHQSQPSTNPYHALEASVHPRQQLLGVPQIGSAATGHIDGRSSASSHSPSSHPYKKDSTHSQLSSLHNSASEKRVISDHSKKVFNARTVGHQGSSVSPGPVGLAPAHSPVQWPPVIQTHTSHPSLAQSPHLMLAGNEQSNRRVNSHLSSQMRSEAPMHGPPPAHAMSQSTNVPRTLPQTPPHASQVPAHGDQFILTRYPVMWQGLLALKNDQAAVQMHFVSGNPCIARASLPPIVDGEASPVRIAQRMRLEHLQLEGVKKKIQMEQEHCVLMALPCGKDHMDVLQQSSNLKNGFINYLLQKQAAGIVNAAPPGSQQPAYVIHIFPSCSFTDNNLARVAPDLLQIICEITHLVIVIATV